MRAVLGIIGFVCLILFLTFQAELSVTGTGEAGKATSTVRERTTIGFFASPWLVMETTTVEVDGKPQSRVATTQFRTVSLSWPILLVGIVSLVLCVRIGRNDNQPATDSPPTKV